MLNSGSNSRSSCCGSSRPGFLVDHWFRFRYNPAQLLPIWELLDTGSTPLILTTQPLDA